MSIYDEGVVVLSFVTSLIIKNLPILHLILGFLLAGLTLAFLMRIILTWYPEVNMRKGFWLFLTLPTEPFLKITRKIAPPIGGVDVTPVIWVGLTSLVRELLVGQQGLLSQLIIKSQAIG